jgi:hypothetical protein
MFRFRGTLNGLFLRIDESCVQLQNSGYGQTYYPFILMLKHKHRCNNHEQAGYDIEHLQTAGAEAQVLYGSCQMTNGYACRSKGE